IFDQPGTLPLQALPRIAIHEPVDEATQLRPRRSDERGSGPEDPLAEFVPPPPLLLQPRGGVGLAQPSEPRAELPTQKVRPPRKRVDPALAQTVQGEAEPREPVPRIPQASAEPLHPRLPPLQPEVDGALQASALDRQPFAELDLDRRQ